MTAEIKNPLVVVQSGGGGGNDWGTVTYIDSNDQEQTVAIQSETEVYTQISGSGSSPLIIDGVSIQYDKVKKINLGTSVTSVLNYCGYNMANLEEFTAPSLVSAGDYFLGASKKITTLSLPKLKSVSQRFFANAEIQTDIELPECVYIGYYSFSGAKFTTPCDIILPKIIKIDNTGFNVSTSNSVNFGIVFGENIQRIGDNFMNFARGFNNDLYLPASLTYIGQQFMYGCHDFCSDIICECPASVVNINAYETRVLATGDSSLPMYTTGVGLAGTYRNAWKSQFPDRSSSPFRKLIVRNY